ncbi:MAG: flagellar hook-associated protein [Haliea sp.]|jgi:flagellar hook-associated protein 2|uniref:flagellar filament capping protein FliD n=1 Tax=Haliea sp. TaxID=1932666 RepID=UPI000C5EB6F5|nr:flagellar filament capping protein FliD [Haliea sp.]MBM70512.1 flagellar hook-associated protein [Haliea sp.]|tara:strand:+ start:38018 stop:39481 length:1464 start_codon:yes stop_codon:yes gene_type:complete
MVSVTGVGSGLDIEGLVTQLVAAERAPVENRLLRRETSLTSELSGFGTLKGVLADLQARSASLRNESTFTQRTATSSNSSAFTATASSAAAPGNYSIAIDSLASAQSLASGSFGSADDVVGEGTLTIRFGTVDATPSVPGPQVVNGFTVNPERASASITIDSSNNTLAGVRDAVNAAGIGVSAAIVNDGSGARLLFSASDTGAANAIEISVADAGDGNNADLAGLSRLAFNTGAANLTQTAAASDASFTLNGLALTSASNTVTGVLDGVSLTLKDTTDGAPASLAVSENRAVARGAIEQFVNAYNTFITTASNLTRFDPATGAAGALQGDFSARTVISQVRNAVTASVQNPDGPFGSLAELGITTSASGTLTINSERLNAALEDGNAGLVSLFGRAETGIAERLGGLLGGFLGTGGLLDARTDGLQSSVDAISDDREALNRRLEVLEARYRAQFNALDGLLAQINSTGSFVSEQLANIPLPSDRFSN